MCLVAVPKPPRDGVDPGASEQQVHKQTPASKKKGPTHQQGSYASALAAELVSGSVCEEQKNPTEELLILGCPGLGLGVLLLFAYCGHIPTAIADPRVALGEHRPARAGAPAAVLPANSHRPLPSEEKLYLDGKFWTAGGFGGAWWFWGSTALGFATGRTTLQVQMCSPARLMVLISSHQRL